MRTEIVRLIGVGVIIGILTVLLGIIASNIINLNEEVNKNTQQINDILSATQPFYEYECSENDSNRTFEYHIFVYNGETFDVSGKNPYTCRYVATEDIILADNVYHGEKQ